MITGKLKEELTIETVLEKVSEVQIFRFYCPTKDWELNKAFSSPLRDGDKNPSFIIGTKTGNVRFKDFAEEEHSGDCFKFVKLLYNMKDLNSVLEKIDFDMDLGIRKKSRGEYKRIIQENKDIEVTKRNTIIQVKIRRFTGNELHYWSEYYQSEDDLKAANIYSIAELYLNRRKFPLKDDELRFGYFYPPNGWKIYIPNTNDKRRKWLSNIPLQTVEGLENLRKDKNTLICKSKKDYLVCRKVHEHCCYIQNESLAAFSEDTVKYINENSLNVFYGGDSDGPGKKASYQITNTFGWKHINSPDRLLPEINDLAGWGRKEGLNALKEHFINKGII